MSIQGDLYDSCVKYQEVAGEWPTAIIVPWSMYEELTGYAGVGFANPFRLSGAMVVGDKSLERKFYCVGEQGFEVWKNNQKVTE